MPAPLLDQPRSTQSLSRLVTDILILSSDFYSICYKFIIRHVLSSTKCVLHTRRRQRLQQVFLSPLVLLLLLLVLLLLGQLLLLIHDCCCYCSSYHFYQYKNRMDKARLREFIKESVHTRFQQMRMMSQSGLRQNLFRRVSREFQGPRGVPAGSPGDKWGRVLPLDISGCWSQPSLLPNKSLKYVQMVNSILPDCNMILLNGL